MNEGDPQHKIYLDLDGVILPYWHKSDGGKVQIEPNGPLRSRSELQRGLEEHWIDRHEFYYPAITKRLGALATRGAEIVLSSSRSLQLFIGYPSVREDLGNVQRFLTIDTFAPANIGYKAEAVMRNWQGQADTSSERRGWERHRSLQHSPPVAKSPDSRAVWIDDHATPAALENSPSEYARDIPTIPSLKIISPLGTIGLTMAQLDETEAFLFDR